MLGNKTKADRQTQAKGKARPKPRRGQGTVRILTVEGLGRWSRRTEDVVRLLGEGVCRHQDSGRSEGRGPAGRGLDLRKGV